MEVVSVLLFFYLLMLAFAVLSYVFQSLGMYTIAKRRGIHNPWLAWVPVGSSWLLGSISDQYHYVVKGEERSKRKVLLGLQIGFIALYIAFVACWIWAFGNLFMEAFASGGEQIIATGFSTPAVNERQTTLTLRASTAEFWLLMKGRPRRW